MIRIVRVPPPQQMVLDTKAITDDIVAYLKERAAAPPPPVPPGKKKPKDPKLHDLVSKYSDAKLGLKQHLLSETHGKCAYCESKILHVDYGDIEHIVPKSVRPDLAVDITNLTVACGICNTNKSDYYNERAPLVDPHVDDCRQEIRFAGYGIILALCGARGQFTVRELDLNRDALSKRRAAHFNKFGETYSEWVKEIDEESKYARLLALWDHADPEAEYSSMSLTALEHFRVDPLPPG